MPTVSLPIFLFFLFGTSISQMLKLFGSSFQFPSCFFNYFSLFYSIFEDISSLLFFKSLTDECGSEGTPGVGDGQGGLACCDSWGRKESDSIERLN